MSFTAKKWKNDEAGGTKLNAAALIDLEERLSGYTDDTAGGLAKVEELIEEAELGVTKEEVETLAEEAVTGASIGSGQIAADAITEAKLAPAIRSFVSVKEHGAKGDGESDDTEGLQAAIDAAIAAKLPLFLPAGEYRTTEGLAAVTRQFSMFGAGAELSLLVPSTSDFDALTIGPGEEGSGQVPAGFLRDFGIEGGDAEVTATGIKPDTGKAALKLDGLRTLALENVYVGGEQDIGVSLINDCFGTTFRNCRCDQNACRVGINLNDGDGGGAGSDVNFFDCWIDGEVAAVVIGSEGGGYHFYGGQLSSSRGAEEDDDERGTVMIGREYVSEEVGSPPEDPISFNGMDFEEIQHSWMIRTFAQCVVEIASCRFNASAEDPAIGVYKASKFGNSRLMLTNNRLAGTFSAEASDLLTIEGSSSGHQVNELGTCGGTIHVGEEEEVDVNNAGLMQLIGKELNGIGASRWNLVLGGLLLAQIEGKLQVSSDWGETYKAVELAP